MLSCPWAESNLHCSLGESIVRRSARPDIRLAYAQIAQALRGKRIQRRICFLDVLQPCRRGELVENDLG